MTSRRITRTLGAAVGGLFCAAYLPAAFAFADDIDITALDTETVSGFYGLHTVSAPPAVPGTVEEYGEFEYTDTTTGDTGTFYGYETIDQASRNLDTYLVTDDVSGNLNNGSLIAIETEGRHDETIYSDIVSSSGTDTSTQTHVSLSGSTTSAESFDPSKYLTSTYLDQNVPFADSDVPLSDGYEIVPIGGEENVTAINGLDPVDLDVQGTQEFELVDGTDVIGKFDALQTNTVDTFGNWTEELLVNADVSGTSGTGAGDIPPVGSVFNYFLHASDEKYTLYSDLPSSNGTDDITYSTYNHGHEYIGDTKYDVDAVKAFDLYQLKVPSDNGITMIPTTDTVEDISGINGLPPYDMAAQGYEQFDIDNSSGTEIGVVDTDVSTVLRSDGHSSEAFLVTDVGSGTAGTGTGDVPPVGSVFDAISDGAGNEYLVYSDIPTTSTDGDVVDVIKEYRVDTATGAVQAVRTKWDLAAGLYKDDFINPFASDGVSSASSSVDASDLTSSVDPSTLASTSSADSVTDPLLHSGALLDPLPHIEAALQFLTGLF